jgi:uncharacterized tellurite resistance protein B-like protein
MSTITAHTALIYVMTVAAVADGKLKESEVATINEFVQMLPVFAGYDRAHLKTAIGDCSALLDSDEGLDAVIGLAKEALPPHLRETAYALACDIVAVDGKAFQEELRWLEIVRHELNVTRLHAAAIERGSRARYMRF